MESLKRMWNNFQEKYPGAAKWIREGGMFYLFSNLVTVWQYLFKNLMTALQEVLITEQTITEKERVAP